MKKGFPGLTAFVAAAVLLCGVWPAAAPPAALASEPFLGEIKMVGFNFAPRGWALCDGQILPINQNQSLYSLLGTTYGGDGRTTFGLPDLRGRAPIHIGNGIALGVRSGQETASLNAAQVQGHGHQLKAVSAAGSTDSPDNGTWAAIDSGTPDYSAGAGPAVPMAPGLVQVGESSAGQAPGVVHENMPPFRVLNYIIALQGTFPPRN